METQMRKVILATTLTLMCSSAFAQNSTGPAPQSDNMNKPGTTNGTMDKGSMDKGSMNNTTGMSKDGMSKDGMKKDSMSKDGMKKDGMSK
jgi:pentapeptide MXKDX repeat protein